MTQRDADNFSADYSGDLLRPWFPRERTWCPERQLGLQRSPKLLGVQEQEREEWDVAVVGAGPAGLAAASAAAAAGARTIVLERAEHPRYKTCGGGLIGASRAAASGLIDVPARDEIHLATLTLRGGQEFTRSHDEPLLAMVVRDEFDSALLKRAEENGAQIRQRTQVRAIDQADGRATARLADGTGVSAKVIIGADGSSGVTARHVGA